MQRILSLMLLLSCTTAVLAQTVRPITEWVNKAKTTGTEFQRFSPFKTITQDLNDYPSLQNGLSDAVILGWNESVITQMRDANATAIALQIGAFNLELVPARNFSDEFQVHYAETGLVAQVDRGTHYWGIVANDEQSLVSISIFDQEVMGFISTAEGQWTLGIIPGRTDKSHVLYATNDLKAQNNFECHTDETLHQIGEQAMDNVQDRSVGPDNCVRMFIETDYTLFQNKGSVDNVTTYMTGVMSQVSALYTNESINLVLHDLFVWSTNDPYTGPSSSNYLTQFRTAKNGVFNGDLAHLVGIHNLGGVAYLDVLCFPSYGVGYSSIQSSYSNVPTYSWTVEVLTHEIGHNLGSPHTHACEWNGNNTPLDGCGPTAGYSEGCTTSLPTNGGTIMSYCHLVNGVGINFNNGFGTQPGDLIRNKVYNASCLNICGGGGGPCTYGPINSNNFDSGFGIWTDGGTDCARINNAAYANSGTYSIQLRDNTNTSVMTTSSQNWSAYEEITVSFSYYAVSFDNSNEDFWVQISTNGGSTYTTVGDYNFSVQFSNNQRNSGTVVIPGPFTSTTRLRFRSDASADDDQVYIDDVVITGCSTQLQGNSDERDLGIISNETNELSVSELYTAPNPVHDMFRVVFDANASATIPAQVMDITGRIIMQMNWAVSEGQNQFNVPAGNLANGLYLVSVGAGEMRQTVKMLVQH
jgi:Metallo-peptidase family M12/Secretion system C-terminal sorting domain